MFVAAAELRSMSGAAAKLGISQSAVSQAILNLENVTGRVLFDRSVRPPALTLVGRIVLQHAADLLQRVQGLEQAISYSEGKQVPHLRIGMINSFAVAVGPFLFGKIRDLATRWSVTSQEEDTSVQAVLDHRVDVVVTARAFAPSPDIVTLPVLAEPYMIGLPPGYADPISSMAELCDALDLIQYGKAVRMGRWLDEYLVDIGLNPPRRFQFDTFDTVVTMVAAGLGWSVTSPLTLMKPFSQFRVRCQPFPDKVPMRNVFVAARATDGAELALAVQQMSIEIIRSQHLGQMRELIPELADKIVLGENNWS